MHKIVEKKGSILWAKDGINYNVCQLIQKNIDGNFSYEFVPNYFVLSLINKDDFDGIQGIDLNQKQNKYIRDFIPTFISERVPPENRIGLSNYLKTLNLDYYDPLEILFKNKNKYTGDSLYVVPFIETKTTSLDNVLSSQSTNKNILALIQWLALGNKINDIADEKMIFKHYYKLYEKSQCFLLKGKPKQKEIQDEYLKILFVGGDYKITLEEAIKLSGLSKSTFIRRMHEFEKKYR